MKRYPKKQLISFIDTALRERLRKGETFRLDGKITVDMLCYSLYVLEEELK